MMEGTTVKTARIPHGLYTLDVLWRCLTSILEEMWDKLYPVIFTIIRTDNCRWHISYKSECIHVDSTLLGDVIVEICNVIEDAALHVQKMPASKTLSKEDYRYCGLRVCKRTRTPKTSTSRYLHIYYQCPISDGCIMYNIKRNPLHQYVIPSCNTQSITEMQEYGDDSLLVIYFNKMCVAAGVREWHEDIWTDHVEDQRCKTSHESSSFMTVCIFLLVLIIILFIVVARHFS